MSTTEKPALSAASAALFDRINAAMVDYDTWGIANTAASLGYHEANVLILSSDLIPVAAKAAQEAYDVAKATYEEHKAYIAQTGQPYVLAEPVYTPNQLGLLTIRETTSHGNDFLRVGHDDSVDPIG